MWLSGLAGCLLAALAVESWLALALTLPLQCQLVLSRLKCNWHGGCTSSVTTQLQQGCQRRLLCICVLCTVATTHFCAPLPLGAQGWLSTRTVLSAHTELVRPCTRATCCQSVSAVAAAWLSRAARMPQWVAAQTTCVGTRASSGLSRQVWWQVKADVGGCMCV